jgi:chromosome segregation ATPase
MIKDFDRYFLNEEETSKKYVQELLDKIQSLENQNSDLVDRIDELTDEIRELEKSNDDQSEKIYGLEESFEKLEEENSSLEDELKGYEKLEEEWIDEKKDLERELEIYTDSYKIFDSGDEQGKTQVIHSFLDMLDLMEDLPIEFGSVLRKEIKSTRRFERLVGVMLNKEWVDTYTGSAVSFINRFGKKPN